MTEEIKRFLHQVLNKVDGLYCIVITDKDGVPFVKVGSEKAPELATRPPFLSTFGIVADQVSKLGLGKSKSFTCIYSNYQVIQINRLPLVVTFIADVKANTGYIYTLEKQMQSLLNDLRDVIFDQCQ